MFLVLWDSSSRGVQLRLFCWRVAWRMEKQLLFFEETSIEVCLEAQFGAKVG